MIQVSTISDNTPFKLLGLYGEFSVTPSKWKVCHFSTFASSQKKSRAGNSASLLAELKPMRERVKPRDISDMSALLQRDLNDARVANELVPYLIKSTAEIGFFPAVLCALLPSGFLETDNEDNIVEYPERVIHDATSSSFGNNWKLTFFKNQEGEPSALGELWIDPSTTDIVVLDGQHRANAFRYVTGSFPDATKSESIYHCFYKNTPKTTNFNSELPVTIVWFEKTSGEKINPRIISRRLFVDVNTNAKAVNQSRNILLDDVTPSSVFATILYTELAKNSFSSHKLSLLHGAFDCENDIVRSTLSLFSPAAIEYAFRLFILGKDDCDSLSYVVQRDRSKDHLNINRLGVFIDTLSAELQENIVINSILKSLHDPIVRIGLAQSAIGYAYRILSEFSLFKLQIEASNEIENAVKAGAWSNTTRIEVWEKIYCGGEGLFSSLRSEASGNGTAVYVTGIDEIEEKFKELRANKFGANAQPQTVKDAYAVASSIAGIAAILMAASKCAQSNGWEYMLEGNKVSCIQEVISYLNKTTPEQWLEILTDFKEGAIGRLEPKRWPQLRNLYLRIIENNSDGKYTFFKSNFELSPDFKFVQLNFENSLKIFKASKAPDYEPTPEDVKSLRQQSIKRLEKCLDGCGVKSIVPADFPWPEGVQNNIEIQDDDDSNSNDIVLEDDDEYAQEQI
jgi:hypothetical protein